MACQRSIKVTAATPSPSPLASALESASYAGAVSRSGRVTFRAVRQVLAGAGDAITWLPLTVEVAERYLEVPHPAVKDPFDRIIVATAWAAGVPLVTADGAIRTSGSPAPVIW